MAQDPLYELREWLAQCTLSEFRLLLKIIRKLQAHWRGCIARLHAKNLRNLFQTYGYTPAHVKAARIFQKRFRGRKCRLRVKRVRIIKHVSCGWFRGRLLSAATWHASPHQHAYIHTYIHT